MSMSIGEAIYCMKAYLPEHSWEDCINCKYYGSVEVDERTYICQAAEAHRMAIKALEKMKENNSDSESDLETPEDCLYFDTAPEHLRLEIDVPEDCARCVFGEEGGYCCALTGGEICTRENGRQVWCPFDNDGSTITVPGVKIVKDIRL